MQLLIMLRVHSSWQQTQLLLLMVLSGWDNGITASAPNCTTCYQHTNKQPHQAACPISLYALCNWCPKTQHHRHQHRAVQCSTLMQFLQERP